MTRSRPTICLLSADNEAIGSDSAASSGSNPIRLKTSVASTAPRSNGSPTSAVSVTSWAATASLLRTRDPASPLLSGALGTPSACFHCFSQFHREDLGEYPIVQALLDGAVSGAGTTNAVPVYPGALDRSLVAQRVQVEAHGGDVQPDARSELDGVNRAAVRTHHLKHSFTLPVARQAISSPTPGLGVCFLVHRSLTFSYI